MKPKEHLNLSQPDQNSDRRMDFDPDNDKKRRRQELEKLRWENKRLLILQKEEEQREVADVAKNLLAALREDLLRGEKKLETALFELENVGNIPESTKREMQEMIQSIIERIEALEDLSDYGDFVPVHLRVTWSEYQKALQDPWYRPLVQGKIQDTLSHLASYLSPWAGGLPLFRSSFLFLHKSLVIIQETHIDMKEGLEKMDHLQSQTGSSSTD